MKAMGIVPDQSAFTFERVFQKVRDGEVNVINNPYYEKFLESYSAKRTKK